MQPTREEEIVIVQKSYGKMHRARKKMRKPQKSTITDLLRTFKIGEKVHLIMRSNGRFQHPRFHGRTGTVIAKSGRSYVVEISDGSLSKKLYLSPEHLKSSK